MKYIDKLKIAILGLGLLIMITGFSLQNIPLANHGLLFVILSQVVN